MSEAYINAIVEQLINNGEWVFVGIDTGMSGGVYIQRAEPTPGEPEGWFVQWSTVKDHGMRELVDALKFITLKWVIEEVFVHSGSRGSKSTAYSQGFNAGWWSGTLGQLRVPFLMIPAGSWQRKVVPDLVRRKAKKAKGAVPEEAYDDWKSKLVGEARAMFPNSYIVNEGGDAALISQYARICWKADQIQVTTNEPSNTARAAPRRVSAKARKDPPAAG